MSEVENLLREIRDLQQQLLDEMRGHNQGVEARGDIVFGNPDRNRILISIFLFIAVSFILGVLFYFVF